MNSGTETAEYSAQRSREKRRKKLNYQRERVSRLQSLPVGVRNVFQFHSHHSTRSKSTGTAAAAGW